MIFVDASYYIGLLKPTDTNRKKAQALAKRYKKEKLITSQAVLGEVNRSRYILD
ncbi:hypothetical protein HY086_05410 [Candidatus Gottesmanbacteria bacterium]|nr:hypothetical protein [Candidatus Gottesmanbacteria bacterium]